MVVDVYTYNGEQELWDIHYNVLKDHVDQFMVIQFDKTFSGLDKPLYPPPEWAISLIKKRKVRWLLHTEDLYGKYQELAESSPNTQGADHWKREFMQKESIKDALTHLKDDDIVFIGDVDEVWNPKNPFIKGDYKWVAKLKLHVYAYWLNNHSSEQFWGTIVGPWGLIKNECLNHLRTTAGQVGYHGWHFTSMGGPLSLRKKLTDSYTQDSYATPYVLENLEYNMAENKDFLGRDFTYTLDESDWPQYLKDNKDKYKHLIKQS